jgi:hypothetical protein
VVHITAAEIRVGTDQTKVDQVPPLQDFHYNLGAANVWVSNIGPHRDEYREETGGVEFYLHVDWDSPIDVAITIIVENDLPLKIQGYEGWSP